MATENLSTVTVSIEALSAEGAGIGPIVENPANSSAEQSEVLHKELIGKKCIVPFTIPGERALVTLEAESRSKTLEFGTLVRIEGPQAQSRTKPPCPYFGICGGCALQHMEIAAQRNSKLEMVSSLLKRHAQLEPRDGYQLLGADLPGFEYRNRIHLHLSKSGALGFYRTGTGETVDINQCLLAEPQLHELLTWVRPFRTTLAPRVAAIKLELRAQHPPVILLKPRERGTMLEEELRMIARPDLTILHDEHTESDAGHFSQVNTRANRLLVDTAVQKLLQLKSRQRQSSTLQLTEFYAGAGNFTFPLAENGFAIDAIELDAHLTEAATKRAQELPEQIRPHYFTMSCERFLKGKHPTRSLVLLDPPRAGAKAVAESISPKHTSGIVYVSCNPATLARDLKTLHQRGFTLEQISVLDMFSQTAHVESIAVLSA